MRTAAPARRTSPRIAIEALCWEHGDGADASGLAVDLSSLGVRIERPYTGGPTRVEVPLELELPGLDDLMWAKGRACFDVVVPARGPAGGALGLVRRTGYRIVGAARRDLRMLEELVVETDRAQRRASAGAWEAAWDAAPARVELALAACYRRA